MQKLAMISDSETAQIVKIQLDLAMIELLKKSAFLAREHLSNGMQVADFLRMLENRQREKLQASIE